MFYAENRFHFFGEIESVLETFLINRFVIVINFS